MTDSNQEAPAGQDIRELSAVVEKLTDETRALRMSLHELRDSVLSAVRQMLALARNSDTPTPDLGAPSEDSASRMDELSRLAMLQDIRDRWFNEPLALEFPSLGIDITNPRTCAEFIASSRINTTVEADDPEQHYSTPAPWSTLIALSAHFRSALHGQADPKILSDAFTVLEVFKADSAYLAAHFSPDTAQHDETLHASYLADAKAAEQCQTILTDLATALGIPLPNKGPTTPD